MSSLHFYYKKNPLQWMQLSGLNVVINNNKTIRIGNWKEVIEEIPIGHTVIQMSMPYLGSEVGLARAEFDVNENEEIYLIYKSPFFVTAPGSIFIERK